MPQEDGRKSRCRLVMTMINRSSHIPMFTTMETKNNHGMFWRTLANHSPWGIRILHRISIQKKKA